MFYMADGVSNQGRAKPDKVSTAAWRLMERDDNRDCKSKRSSARVVDPRKIFKENICKRPPHYKTQTS